MGEIAYRFVPLDPDGQPRESSRYVLKADHEIRVGERLDEPMLGFQTWEVAEIHTEQAGPTRLLGTRDAAGAEIPVAGTLVCRGVTSAGNSTDDKPVRS